MTDYPTDASGRVWIAQVDGQGVVIGWALVSKGAVEGHLRAVPGSQVLTPAEAAKIDLANHNTIAKGVVTSDPVAGLALAKAAALKRIAARQRRVMLTPDQAKAAIAQAADADEIARIESSIQW